MSELDRFSPEHDTDIGCDGCHGTGQDDGKICAHCGGSGAITVTGFEARMIRKQRKQADET
jgi:DnaJ-class molecular chaperone